MSQPIDVAYVDLVARTKEFQRDIKRVIDNEVKDLGKGFDDVLDEIDAHFAATGKHAEEVLKDIDDVIEDVVDSLEDVGSVFDQIGDELDVLNAKLDLEFEKSFRSFREAWEDLDRRNFVVEALKKIRLGVSDLGDSMLTLVRGAGTGFINMLTSIPPLLVPIALALPPIIGFLTSLGAVVTDAAGAFALLPGALSVLVAIITPLVVGFNGFGEAIGAILEKDPEKIAEALKELAPAARVVAREFQGLLPVFKEIGDVVQQALFKPLIGDLTALITRISGPLIGGMANVASTLGDIISDIAGLLASQAGVETLAMVFETTNEILKTMRPVIPLVFGSLLTLIRASLPFLEQLTTLFAGVLKHFSEWIEEAARSGELDKFLTSALESLKFIAGFLGSIIEFFRALFTPETIAGGQIILAILTDMFNRFTEFLKTPTGKRFLEDLTILAIGATQALSVMLEVFGFLFASITLFVGEFIRLITGAGDILDEWKNRAKKTADDIVGAISSVPQKLTALGTSFANAGLSLINSFIGGFRKTGNFISDVAGDIVKGIKGGLNKLIATINSGIANIDAVLPFSIGRIPQLAEGAVVGHRAGGTLAVVGEGREDEVVAPLSKLEEIIRRTFDGGRPDDGAMTISFGPGSINISFASVPTEGEARGVGAAVADGIASQLARRSVRTQVRAA